MTQSALTVLFSLINFGLFSFILAQYNLRIFAVFLLSATLYIGWIVLFLKKRKEIDYVRFQQMGENSGTVIGVESGDAGNQTARLRTKKAAHLGGRASQNFPHESALAHPRPMARRGRELHQSIQKFGHRGAVSDRCH